MRTLKEVLFFVSQEPSARLSQELSRWNDERSKMRPEHFPIFQPDILLPVQYHRTRRTRHLLLPEQKLALAILEDAIACYQHYADSRVERAGLIYRDAETWIMKPDHRWLFSFDRICDLLHLNPTYIRAGLRRWKATRRSGHTPVLEPKPSSTDPQPRAAGTMQARQEARPKAFARV